MPISAHYIFTLAVLIAFLLLSFTLIRIRRRQGESRTAPYLAQQENCDEPVIQHDEQQLESSILFTPEQAAPSQQVRMIRVLAKPGKQFIGFELLQALLSVGLRHGRMNIFHRYKNHQEKGQILFSLARATEPGTFDIKNMGEVACAGLALFMTPQKTSFDDETYAMMLATAKKLSQTLDGELLELS